MRRTLFESLTHQPLTEAPPSPDDAALAELAASESERREQSETLQISALNLRLAERPRTLILSPRSGRRRRS
jgi:hypothetical protein